MTGKQWNTEDVSKECDNASELDPTAVCGDKAPRDSSGPSDEEVETLLKNMSIAQFPDSAEASHVYLDQLVKDQQELKQTSTLPFRHVNKLLDREINRVIEELRAQLSSSESSDGESMGDRITISHSVNVPVDQYPGYNFVGRLLGPRGMTIKQMEEETGCRIMLRGRGSCRFEQGRSRRDRGSEKEPLHVLIQCEDYPSRAHAKMDNAKSALDQLLNPPPEGKDELKRKQLIELSIINGTYRPTAATKNALQMPRASSAAHLPTSMDYLQNSNSAKLISMLMNRHGNQKSETFNTAPAVPNYMYGMMNPLQSSSMNSAAFLADYYKNLQLLSCSLTDPAMMSALLAASQYSDSVTAKNAQQAGHIPQAGMKEYLDAAAMLKAIPFGHDGAGDAPSKHR